MPHLQRDRHASQPCPRSDTSRNLGLGDVRFRQLRLHDGGDHCRVQCLLRRGGRQGRSLGYAGLDQRHRSVLCSDHPDRAADRRLCRRLRLQEAPAAVQHGRLRRLHLWTRAGRTGGARCRDPFHRAIELLLRQRREPDRRLLAPTRPSRCLGQGVRLGLGVRLHRRPGQPGRLSGLRQLGSGAGPDCGAVRAGVHADHRGLVRCSQRADLPVPARTQPAAARARRHAYCASGASALRADAARGRSLS
ncbi:hypothetical protein D3C85_940970 [compost metagenome]